MFVNGELLNTGSAELKDSDCSTLWLLIIYCFALSKAFRRSLES